MPSGIGWYVCRISLKCVENGAKTSRATRVSILTGLWMYSSIPEVVILGARWRCGLLFTLHPLFPHRGQESSGEVSDDSSYDLKYHDPHKYLWLMLFSCFIQQRWMLHMIPTTFSSLYVANHIFPIIGWLCIRNLVQGNSFPLNFPHFMVLQLSQTQHHQ